MPADDVAGSPSLPPPSRGLPPEIRYILVLFLSTRAALTVIGVASRLVLAPVLGPIRATSDQWWVYTSKHLPLDIWGVWDSRWYVDLATHGYSVATNARGQANYAFFPLYPMLMRILGAPIGGPYVAGLLISNACLLAACVLLYRLVRQDEGDGTARAAVKYLMLFPSAFVLSGVFTEALFLALALACFSCARARRWAGVGVSGLLAGLTRWLGILIILPLAYEYLKGASWKLSHVKRDAWYLLLIPLGFLGFLGFVYHLTGDPLASIRLQAHWYQGASHGLTNPLETLVRGLFGREVHAFFGAVFALGSLVLLSAWYRSIGFSYWLMGAYSIVVPLTAGVVSLYSFPRFVLVIFPLYIVLAKVGARDRQLDQALTIISALLQGFLMALWTNGSYLVV